MNTLKTLCDLCRFGWPRRLAAMLAVWCGLMASTAPVLANTLDVAGVALAQRITAHGSALQLNGAGVRYRAVFQVYVAGLYLEQKTSSPDAVLGASGPKRLSITMLRDIDSAELGKLFARGMEDNLARGEFSKLVPGVLRMSDIFSRHKKLRAGDSFSVDWVPGTGTVLTIKGQVEGEPFQEPEFFQALMRIWLGPKPADAALKTALLGGL